MSREKNHEEKGGSALPPPGRDERGADLEILLRPLLPNLCHHLWEDIQNLARTFEGSLTPPPWWRRFFARRWPSPDAAVIQAHLTPFLICELMWCLRTAVRRKPEKAATLAALLPGNQGDEQEREACLLRAAERIAGELHASPLLAAAVQAYLARARESLAPVGETLLRDLLASQSPRAG